MISDIATNAWLIDFCHKAIKPWGLRSLSRNFMADIRISLRNIGGQSMQWWAIHSQDNFYLTCSRNLVAFVIYMDLSLGFVTWICLYLNWLLAVTGVMHEADDAYSVWSTWSCYWLDQFLTLALDAWILSKFSTLYWICLLLVFLILVGVELPLCL